MVRHPPVTIPPGDTLLDVLRWRAEHEPDQTAYVFLRDGVTPDAVLTYRELDLKARSIAGYLQTRFTPGNACSWSILPVLISCKRSGALSMPGWSPYRFHRRTPFV